MTRRQNIAKFINSPRMCGEKRRYSTKREAETVREEQELLSPGLTLHVYKCLVPGCGGWHLTRKNLTQPGAHHVL